MKYYIKQFITDELKIPIHGIGDTTEMATTLDGDYVYIINNETDVLYIIKNGKGQIAEIRDIRKNTQQEMPITAITTVYTDLYCGNDIKQYLRDLTLQK